MGILNWLLNKPEETENEPSDDEYKEEHVEESDKHNNHDKRVTKYGDIVVLRESVCDDREHFMRRLNLLEKEYTVVTYSYNDDDGLIAILQKEGGN